MSIHKDCGEDVKWARRTDDPDKWLPPMEYAGHAYVLQDDGTVQEVMTFRPHRCDTQKVIEWQEYVSTMSELKGPDSFESSINHYQAARKRDREKAWEVALKVECRVCEAEIGVYCISQSVNLLKNGVVQETLNPHPIRLEDGYKL